jgi:hypothetical protein
MFKIEDVNREETITYPVLAVRIDRYRNTNVFTREHLWKYEVYIKIKKSLFGDQWKPISSHYESAKAITIANELLITKSYYEQITTTVNV